jgi:tryptophan synthase alpha chain
VAIFLGDNIMSTNRIDTIFKINKNILTLYLTSGYPDKDKSKDIANALINSNIDILEIGIPFSDPIADGPTIQNTSFIAINAINEPIIDFTFSIVSELRKKDANKPIIIMSYLNLIFQYGIERFAQNASTYGIDAIVIPDLPYNESLNIKKSLETHNIYLIYMVTPTSSPKTINEISQNAKGFIYYVSSTGITGSRETLSEENFKNINEIRKYTEIPILIGFGISSKRHLDIIKPWANGAIVASALINQINDQLADYNVENVENTINNFVNELRGK